MAAEPNVYRLLNSPPSFNLSEKSTSALTPLPPPRGGLLACKLEPARQRKSVAGSIVGPWLCLATNKKVWRIGIETGFGRGRPLLPFCLAAFVSGLDASNKPTLPLGSTDRLPFCSVTHISCTLPRCCSTVPLFLSISFSLLAHKRLVTIIHQASRNDTPHTARDTLPANQPTTDLRTAFHFCSGFTSRPLSFADNYRAPGDRRCHHHHDQYCASCPILSLPHLSPHPA